MRWIGMDINIRIQVYAENGNAKFVKGGTQPAEAVPSVDPAMQMWPRHRWR